jgi:hypothetical protein
MPVPARRSVNHRIRHRVRDGRDPRWLMESGSGVASYIDVLDRVLDNWIVVDAWIRVSVAGLDLITIEALVIVWPALGGAAAPRGGRPTFRTSFQYRDPHGHCPRCCRAH